MEYPVCNLWLLLTEKYHTTQPFSKFSKEYGLDYHKVTQYGSNTFKKFDEKFVLELCEILGCSFEEMITEDEEGYYHWRSKQRTNYLSNEGVVYFVKNSEGLTKIGRTNELRRRMKALKNEYKDYALKLIHFIKTGDSIVLEKTLHRVFADKRAQGEWFRLTDQDLANIKSIHNSRKGDE